MTPRRSDGMEDAYFTPDSLVGSFFHGCATRGWQGLVVAEPHPGVYLLELFSWVMGEASHQQLIRIDVMADEGWQFYDTAEWMNDSYHYGLKQQWEAERAELRGDPADTSPPSETFTLAELIKEEQELDSE